MAEFYARVVPQDHLTPPEGWDSEMKPPEMSAETHRRQLQADLPGLGSLDTRATGQLLIDEINGGVHSVAEVLGSAGLAPPKVPDFPTLIRWSGEQGRYSLAHAILNFHVDLLTSLEAADQAVGKAYGLGRAVADLTLRPKQDVVALFSEDFRAGRVIAITQDLRDLKSALPPHAGEAVGGSIAIWQRWADAPRWRNRPLDWATDRPEVLRALSDQGRQWRLLLAGEKAPLDQLSAEDYVEAAGFLIGRLRQLATKYAYQYWVVLAVVVAVVILGMVLAVTLLASPAAKAAGVAVSLFGGLGITGASVVSTLRKAASSAEDYLWQAELDLAIARASTTLPPHAVLAVVGEPLPPTVAGRRLDELVWSRNRKRSAPQATQTQTSTPPKEEAKSEPESVSGSPVEPPASPSPLPSAAEKDQEGGVEQ
jgi:hypothetical protein